MNKGLEGEKVTFDLLNNLLTEPQIPPVTIGPATFCPDKSRGVIGIHDFNIRNLPLINTPSLKYPVETDISLYLFISRLEECLQPPEAVSGLNSEISLNLTPGTSINDYHLVNTSEGAFHFEDKHQNGAFSSYSVPFSGYMNLEENCYTLGDFMLMQQGHRGSYIYNPPFMTVRTIGHLIKIFYKAYQQGKLFH